MTPQAASVVKERIEAAVVDIFSWMMRDNSLKLNEDQTKLIVITPSWQSTKVVSMSVQVGDCNIKPAHSGRPVILVPHLIIMWSSRLMSH